jgi:ABC-type glycerol-3-phosphate transport system substrate-binding protein
LRYFSLFLLTAGIGLLVLMPPARSHAQDNAVTISLAIPSFSDSIFTDKLISEFETTHPGVKVSVMQVDASVPPTA